MHACFVAVVGVDVTGEDLFRSEPCVLNRAHAHTHTHTHTHTHADPRT